MLKPLITLFITGLLTQQVTSAQEMAFNKKSGEITADAKPIAILKAEKKENFGKDFILYDNAGKDVLLAFHVKRWQDTFASPTQYYYQVQCPKLGYESFKPNFNGSMNTFKEVGEYIVSNHLLQPSGELNNDVVKEYFKKITSELGDINATHARINDSLMKMVNIPAPITERNTRKPITANEYGKIGQDNKVIGKWELQESKKEGFGNDKNYMFAIRNMEGGIICISWIELSGAHTYVFKNGERSDENWNVLDLVNKNPLDTKEHQQAYIIGLTEQLVKAGFL